MNTTGEATITKQFSNEHCVSSFFAVKNKLEFGCGQIIIMKVTCFIMVVSI